jgi:hypothetical protein
MKTELGVDQASTIGRYWVRGQLGRGGFATVYRAWDPLLNREVALKVLLAHLAGDARLRARFLAEARVIAGLRHPAIAVVHDVGEADGVPFFAMELIDGETLAQRTANGHLLALADVVSIAGWLCAAVDALHGASVLHRDIKASNVMVDRGGRVVLMDFGIARATDSTLTTQTEGILGTPIAMAPEQVRGEPVGPAADIYALGVLLYQLLVGQPPFTGEPVQILHAHVYELPPPLRVVRPSLPEAFYRTVEACLAKDPKQRPQPASAIAESLSQTATGPQSEPPTQRIDRQTFLRAGDQRAGLLTAWAVRIAALAGIGVVIALLLALLVFRDGGERVPQAGVPSDGVEAAAGPEVTDLRIYDNVFSRRELAFAVGDSIAACFAVRPSGDQQPLVVVVTNDGQPPGDPSAVSVVARSAPVSNTAAERCYSVTVLARPLPPGTYWVWILHGDRSFGGRSFVAQPSPGDVILADNFDDPTRGILPQVSPAADHFSVAYLDGSYSMAKTNLDFAGVPFVSLPGAFEHASIAFDVRLAGAAVDRYVTVGCRTSSPALDNGYRFSLDVERGRYLLDRWDSGRLTTLESGSAPSARRTAEPYRAYLRG